MRIHRAGAGALIALVVAGCGGGGDGSGRDADADVVQAWTDAVRERHYGEAADLFALPSRIDNGFTIRATRRADVDLFNRSLSCGAELRKTEPASGGRLLATFRLVDGPGGGRCSGEAQVRFRIEAGHITEWIRLDTGPPPDAVQT